MDGWKISDSFVGYDLQARRNTYIESSCSSFHVPERQVQNNRGTQSRGGAGFDASADGLYLVQHHERQCTDERTGAKEEEERRDVM
jgi:hypothetical protein